MENPLSWNPVEKAIYEAITEHEADMAKGIYGYSLPAFIYHKLKDKGFLKEEKYENM